jgi:hypothetical protein
MKSSIRAIAPKKRETEMGQINMISAKTKYSRSPRGNDL